MSIATTIAISGASSAMPDPTQTVVMPTLLVAAGHRGAEVLGRDVLRVELADQPAAQDDLDPVGQADQLVEVGGDQQHGQARRAGPS